MSLAASKLPRPKSSSISRRATALFSSDTEVSFRDYYCLYQNPTLRQGRLKRSGRRARAKGTNFLEPSKGEVPRIHLLGTSVNKPGRGRIALVTRDHNEEHRHDHHDHGHGVH